MHFIANPCLSLNFSTGKNKCIVEKKTIRTDCFFLLLSLFYYTQKKRACVGETLRVRVKREEKKQRDNTISAHTHTRHQKMPCMLAEVMYWFTPRHQRLRLIYCQLEREVQKCGELTSGKSRENAWGHCGYQL
eukprot:GEMP01136513.1.p1 GENE.GEMP01136513.1~~GEMP01136513.1.p1  ORF type:complete len:141 (-),score=4.50 GEMP01136513.1:67-465(-)